MSIALISLVAGILGLLFGVYRFLYERNRKRPVAIAHEDRPRHFSQGVLADSWAVDAHVTCEGDLPAFNVRFGVEMHGIRFPYKLRPEDPDAGNRQRVIRPGERIPPTGTWPVLIPQTTIWSGKGDPDPGRVYWCRYEDSGGTTWESRNPGNRSANLRVKRVRALRVRERWEERKRRRAKIKGIEWEKQALAELLAERDEQLSQESTKEPKSD